MYVYFTCAMSTNIQGCTFLLFRLKSKADALREKFKEYASPPDLVRLQFCTALSSQFNGDNK